MASSAVARCAPAAASTRCSAPTGSAPASPGGGSSPSGSRPGSSRRRCTSWPSRSSPTSTRCRPSRPRATRSSSRSPPARPSSAAAGSCGCWSASRRSTPPPRGRPPPRRGGRFRGCWRRSRSAARRRDAAASRLPPDAISETIGDITCALLPDPEGPGRRATVERAIVEAGARAGLGTTVGWARGGDQLRACARRRSSLSGGAPALSVARERAGELLLRSEPRLAGELAERPARTAARAAAGLARPG